MGVKQKRFDYYEPFGDLGDPEAIGLIAGDKDFDFGTPNLERQEDLLYVAANSSLSQCLLARFKWRPDSERSGQVTLISKLTLVLNEQTFEFEQIETYKPAESTLRPGRFTQYGSGSAKLKLVVTQPYRRSRLIFNGHMRRSSGGQASDANDDSLVFVKLGCMVHPVTHVFDFLEQYDESCMRQIYAQKKPVRTFNQVITNLLSHDRHEQKVRFAGEYLIVDYKNNTRHQEKILVFGFYARHFSSQSNATEERNISTRRFYAYMNNGQAFHVARRKFDLDEIDFGYTALVIAPKSDPIDKPYKLDWHKLDGDNSGGELEMEISGQEQTFESCAKRKLANWFEVKMNGKPGWGWMSSDDGIVSGQEELEAIARSRSEIELATSAGKLMGEIDLSSSESELLVVSIEEEACLSSELVGAKAASLAQLQKFTQTNDQQQQQQQVATNYKVPFAFVLTKFAHDLILEVNANLAVKIRELQHYVGAANDGDLTLLKDKCKELSDLVSEQSKLPDEIKNNLWSKLTQHYGEHQVDSEQLAFAARSSSWGEDEDDMSAAGQLSTILNVKFNCDHLSRAIMSCFASKFNYENIEYKRQHGVPLDLPMAVVVQEMVACEKAGVMFTCDPTTGDESLITITANYGLGESVVSAQADPDSIVVRTTDRQLDVATIQKGLPDISEAKFVIDNISIGEKKVIIGGGGEQSNHVDRSKCCLEDDEIIRLAKCGLQIKRFFHSQRRDIEWGYLKGELFLFQSRPVTGLDSFSPEELVRECDRPTQAELNYFTRANLGEVMPYAITPFTLTYSVFIWNVVGARLFYKYHNRVFYVPQCSSDVVQEKYHSFFSLRCSMLLPLSEPKRNVVSKSLEIGFFGREMGVQPEITEASRGLAKFPSPFEGKSFYWRTLPLRLMPNYLIMREKPVMDRLRADVRSLKLAQGYQQDKLVGLYNQVRSATRCLYNCWENHISIIMFATKDNMFLSFILAKYIKDPMQLSAATNKFLAISPDVISAEIPERIANMAKLIQAKGHDETKKFVDMNDEEALAYLQPSSSEFDNKQLKQQFEDFMQNFGHRCYNEFELAELAWREKPEVVVDMIKKNCAALLLTPKAKVEPENEVSSTTTTTANNLDKESNTTSSNPTRPKTIDEVIESLNIELTFKDRLLLKYQFAPKCQQMLAMREKTKNILVLYTDVLREATRMLAEEMQRQLRLPDKDLFYYLTYDELAPLVRTNQPSIVCQALRRRQMFKRLFSEPWKFDEIISNITPNHMKPSKELDEAIAQAPRLSGTPASSGKVQGKICLVNGYKELNRVKAGSILLTHSTDIAFSPVFPLIAGIITEVGGLISHGAVVAREYGLPSVIGIPDVTRILQDGEEIILDADNGAIIRLDNRNGAA